MEDPNLSVYSKHSTGLSFCVCVHQPLSIVCRVMTRQSISVALCSALPVRTRSISVCSSLKHGWINKSTNSPYERFTASPHWQLATPKYSPTLFSLQFWPEVERESLHVYETTQKAFYCSSRVKVWVLLWTPRCYYWYSYSGAMRRLYSG